MQTSPTNVIAGLSNLSAVRNALDQVGTAEQAFTDYRAGVEQEFAELTEQLRLVAADREGIRNELAAAQADLARNQGLAAQLESAQMQNNNNSQLIDSYVRQIAAAQAALNPPAQ